MSDRSDRLFSPRANRRRFVAERIAEPVVEPVDSPEAVAATPFDDDDDLPLLTEVVHLHDSTTADLAPPPLPPLFTEADAETIVANVEASLRAQIPALIAAATATLEEDLKRGLTALVEDSLRDALSEYLPLPEFGDDEGENGHEEEHDSAATATPPVTASEAHSATARPADGDPV